MWAGLCFLPGDWRTTPEWLARIVPSLPDPERVGRFMTPQGWISLQAYLSFLSLLAWGACVTGLRWRTEERNFGLSAFTGGITIVSATFLYMKVTGTPWPGATHDEQFGPFPNRNQTAALFAIGAVCATGLLLANGRRHWKKAVIAAFCLAVLAAAVTQAGSRAGVLTMAAGVVAISVWWAVRSRQLIPLSIGASILLLACSYLILNGGRLTERLSDSFSGNMSEGRIAIWKDTGKLIGDSPFLGTGLGNFEPAVAQARDASVSEYRIKHPESDWLWLIAEIGIPGGIAVAIYCYACS